ncbi:hypothetical protein [Nocardioides sp.]|uniref:hypothetical protein n=1 Tax=Nocardioides sp. TaxID=35761 RepID=UPI002ED4C014
MKSRLTTIAAALAASLALVAPAQAQLTVTEDAREGASSDIKKVTTHHNPKRVKIKTRTYGNSKLPHEMWHLVDTQGDARPDFLVFVVIKNEVDPQPSVGVRRVDGWPKRKNPYRLLHRGEDVTCGLEKGYKRDRSRLLVVVTGRGCFKTDGEMPKRLRVSTFGTWEWGTITDVVPSWKKYGRWVKAG